MANIKKFNVIEKILYGLSIVAPTLALLWIVGMLIQWINGVKSQDLSFFLTYGQITLTLFGFTMISAIFEKTKNKSKELKELFYLSIIFLVSSISFFYLYFTSFLLIGNKLIEWIYITSVTISLIIAFSGFVFGLFLLLQILLKFSTKLQKIKSNGEHNKSLFFKNSNGRNTNLTTNLRKNKKDLHDYINIYGMLLLTAIMVMATVIIAYSAFYKIPEKIEESSSYFDWRQLNYKEQLIIMNTTFITDDPNEPLYECDRLSKGEEKTLKEHFACNNGNVIEIHIIKDSKGDCFQRFVGGC